MKEQLNAVGRTSVQAAKSRKTNYDAAFVTVKSLRLRRPAAEIEEGDGSETLPICTPLNAYSGRARETIWRNVGKWGLQWLQ